MIVRDGERMLELIWQGHHRQWFLAVCDGSLQARTVLSLLRRAPAKQLGDGAVAVVILPFVNFAFGFAGDFPGQARRFGLHVGERALGLPKEPNNDKTLPFSELPKRRPLFRTES